MILQLPTVTLLGIDFFKPARTIRAMWFSMRRIGFADAILVTNRPVNTKVTAIKIHQVSTGPERINYERTVVRQSHHFFKTPHCLFVEWDSFVANPFAWDDRFLRYDFIGAPWHYPFDEKPHPPCTEANCVGNGGFALKSRDFCEALESYADPNDPAIRLSDVYMCRTLRPALEKLGARFAPEDLAMKFSCENRLYTQEFGIHGKWTMKFNGINLEELTPIVGPVDA